MRLPMLNFATAYNHTPLLGLNPLPPNPADNRGTTFQIEPLLAPCPSYLGCASLGMFVFNLPCDCHYHRSPIRCLLPVSLLCLLIMSRSASCVVASADTPVRAHISKGTHANCQPTRNENHRELRHGMHHKNFVLPFGQFMEYFIPEPDEEPTHGKTLRSDIFNGMPKPGDEAEMYRNIVSSLRQVIGTCPSRHSAQAS